MGMSCASCAASIEKELKALPYVQDAQINYATESGKILVDRADRFAEISSLVKKMGYELRLTSDRRAAEGDLGSFGRTEKTKLIVALSLASLVMVFAMGPLMHWPSEGTNYWIQLILTTPVWLGVGFKYQRAVLDLFRSGRSNMNTLIGVGTSAAFLYSLMITLAPTQTKAWGFTQAVYYEAVGFIIAFVLLGQFFESKAKRKAKEALQSLLKMQAKTASVLLEGKEEARAIDAVNIGDVIRVRPGESIPIDGVIVRGESHLNEAMMSGEPLPIWKSIEDPVFAGTLNVEGTLDIKTTKIGAETMLAKITRFVDEAQNNKPNIQRFADRVSAVFVPAVIALSLLTFAAWMIWGPEPRWGYALSNAIAVLVIACPCALGLATPTAVVVATSRASLKGLLIAGGDVIEKAQGITAMIFDKTGTLTEGRPEVAEILFQRQLDEATKKKYMQAIASTESYSEHPLSHAIVRHIQQFFGKNAQDPDAFRVLPGRGLEATLDGVNYLIGSPRLMAEQTPPIDTFDDRLTGNHHGSLVQVAIQEGGSSWQALATILIADRIKPGMKEMIANIHQLGIQTWLVTGDRKAAGEAVAKELGIQNLVAEALPERKQTILLGLQEQGYKVAMVGDGINDAPALASADLSFAMGSGTDVAMETADVTIVRSDLERVLDFLRISRGTMKIIKQNLFLSLAYNVALIPVAAGVLYLFGGPLMPPMLASFAMGLSSLSVVGNSLRVRGLI
jgi:heavy metal translocating P-type ATPase